jgi:starvation-inducible DNA-binding protein
MLVSTPSHAVPVSAEGDAESHKTISVLSDLLVQSIALRDLYKNARWQTAHIQYHRLRQLFERHYKEQSQLVDVLTDRIRTLGGARKLFASNYLQETRFACALRGNKPAARLLCELLDAHETVLYIGRPNGSAMEEQWARDFAVGQVLLTNDAQSFSIGEQLSEWEPSQRLRIRREGATLYGE